MWQTFADLLHDVQLAEPVDPSLLGERVELVRVLLGDVSDVAEPVVDQPVPRAVQRGATPPQP